MQGSNTEQNSANENEHVLVLDFINKAVGKSSDSQALVYFCIRARNSVFMDSNWDSSKFPASTCSDTSASKETSRKKECAICGGRERVCSPPSTLIRLLISLWRLINATPSGEDPVQLLQAAARDHVPINPIAVDVLDEQGPQAVPSSNERASIDEIIEDIKLSNTYRDQIVDRRIFHAKEARLGKQKASDSFAHAFIQMPIGHLAQPLSDAIMDALRQSRKITEFYVHQINAIDAIRQGKHVIVSTSTASGKSVIYQVSVFIPGSAIANSLNERYPS